MMAAGGSILFPGGMNSPSSKDDGQKKLTVLVAGAHPDDPETGAGGTILRYTLAGHRVVVLYFTRGEAGIENVAHSAAAEIRTGEATEACRILGAEPVFFGQIDGATEINRAAYERMKDLLNGINPDVILTHWPIDTHRDHRICSGLVYDAWLASVRKAALYYFEVCTGGQSQNFQPTHFVDISPVIQKKWDACFVHESQKIKEWYPTDHAKMEMFRGLECQAQYGEAFVHHWISPDGLLPL
jgi:LmbE family N-acetylglucosaminyl deacetylase